MKNLFLKISLFLLLIIIPISAHASGFVINLFYNINTQTLNFDNKATQNVVLDQKNNPDYLSFAQDKTQGQYILKLYDANKSEIVSTEFNKQDGAFQLTIPYFSLATSLKIFEKSSNKELLNANLSQFNTCNGNGICEFEKGESLQTCLGDCGTSKPQFSPETLQKLKENNGTIKDPTSGDVLLQDPALIPKSVPPQAAQKTSFLTYLILILAAAALIVAGYIMYKKYKNRNE